MVNKYHLRATGKALGHDKMFQVKKMRTHINNLQITIIFVPLAICYPAVSEANSHLFLLNCTTIKHEHCKSYLKSSPEGKF